MKIDTDLQNRWKQRQAIALIEFPDLGGEALTLMSNYLPEKVLATLAIAQVSMTMAAFWGEERLLPTLVVQYSDKAILADSKYFDELKQLSHYCWLILGISQVTVCGRDRQILSCLSQNQNAPAWILSTLWGYK
jgi:hypothetical protein